MENSVAFDPPPSTYNHDDLFPGYAEPLAIPPLDDAMLSCDLSFPDNFLDSDIDPDFNIEDLDFNLDDLLCDPAPGSNSESTDHHSSLSQLPCVNFDQNSVFWSPEAEGFYPALAVKGSNVDDALNRGTDRGSDGLRVSDMEYGHNDRDSSGHASSHDSYNGGCNFAKASNHQSSGSDSKQKSDSLSPESGSCDQIGSRGSGVSPVENPSSPESCEGAHAFTSSVADSTLKAENLSPDGLAKSKKKSEEVGKCNPKRKKEQRDEGSAETRTSKFRKSSSTFENANMSINVSAENEGDDKKMARLMRNRESAQLSRQRKKQYVEELEDKVRSMHSTIAALNNRVTYMMAENATLRQQLSGGGVCPPVPHPGMYPTPPMGYPWMPCPPYAVKQGSQVPLVPIPRLKPQRPAPAPAPKVNKNSDKKKKSQGKTKKLASISFLGLLFFMLLFGGLVPILHVRYGGIGGKVSVVDRFNDLHRGRALMVDDGGKCYSDGRCGHEHGRHQEKHFGRIPLEEDKMLQFSANTNGSVVVGNSSEPLVASLYVPRNDKLVRIDGNLIIHSVLASDKAAMESHATGGQMKTSEETRLAIARNYLPTYHVAGAGRSNGRSSELDRDHTGRQKALGSGSADNMKTPAPDGRLKQWFLDDLAGPLLSSGMCTEVFQFDVSPSPGSIVPATSIPNEYRQNSTRLKRSRRILRGHAIPLKGHAYNNLTDKHAEVNAEKVGLEGNKSSSSIVVSVLVDPREVSDVESEGMMRSKTLSQIFVVLLTDSVKYVTYSCMLPLMGSSPHMVTA